MEGNSPKMGRFIVVHGSRPCVGTSTVAALTASTLASKGHQVLLITTDPDAPFDSVSTLSHEASECYLNELVALSMSGAISNKVFSSYVSRLTDNFAYLRPSSPLEGMAYKPGDALLNIINVACENFNFVVVDVDYLKSSYATQLTKAADLVIHILGQDAKSIRLAKTAYHDKALGEDGYILPVVCNFRDDLPTGLKQIEKELAIGAISCIHADNEIFEAGRTRNMYDLAAKPQKKRGLFGGKRHADQNMALIEISDLCNLIQDALGTEKGV